jgi:hypothetical protein
MLPNDDVERLQVLNVERLQTFLTISVTSVAEYLFPYINDIIRMILVSLLLDMTSTNIL